MTEDPCPMESEEELLLQLEEPPSSTEFHRVAPKVCVHRAAICGLHAAGALQQMLLSQESGGGRLKVSRLWGQAML